MHKNFNKIIKIIIHCIEYAIAIITIFIAVLLIALEIMKMFTQAEYFADANTFLHNILTIVIILEFVRMLINFTPANTLEVLTVAISRQVIINHSNPINNLICVLCIGGLFAIRRFLIPRGAMKTELSDME